MARQSGKQPPQALYSLVAIGASAGGIEALSIVLGALPASFPAPIVVAQHLDPHHPSHLDTILGRRTALPVRLVTDAARLMPGTVYVVPSDRDVEIDDHEVRVRASGGTPSIPSINRLLSTAARVFGERLIAVILTGTGSDGAAGAREVKAAGGTVVIEDPATAAFPGMPRSLAPTTVDIVAHLDQIGPLLNDLLTTSQEEGAFAAEDEALAPLLAQLRDRSGIDFSGYRQPTILRRLQRRMAASKSATLDDYRRYLARNPDEYPRLVSSFLIKVTEFFRDVEFFDALRERILPELIAHARTHGKQLRLWSAGCATGEEAYSLAILLAEALGPELSQFNVRLFATDLDERAVAFARQAIYPAAALAGVPEELRQRYFTQLDGTFEVNKPIRALVTCGEHDLGQRPPFPRIDLVLCRNVLIYFTPEMQQRALSLFAFALRPGGYLLLGKAESARALADYFAPADAHLKLFRRIGETLPPPPLLQARGSYSAPRPPMVAHTRRQAAGTAPLERNGGDWQADEDWLTESDLSRMSVDFPFGMVVVDHRYHVHAINSAALRLLDIYRPAIGGDLVHLAEHVPGAALRRIVDAVFQASAPMEHANGEEADNQHAAGERQAAATEILTIATGLGERRDIQISGFPRLARAEQPRQAEARVETALLLVTDVTSAVAARISAEQAAMHDRRHPDEAHQRRGEELERLTAQLERVAGINRQLAAANQELGSANLDLQRASDELLLAHEQEQATAEEIRTLNEELQASNEELETVNEELEATVEELRASNDDLAARTLEVRELANEAERQRQVSEIERARLQAILQNLGDAVLVMDPTGQPLLVNAAYTELFGDAATPFAAQDLVGHPLPREAMPQQRAARGETFLTEFTLEGADGQRRYFETNGQPIHSEGVTLGGVITVRDITERSVHRLQDEFLALASHELRTPLTPLLTYLQMLDRYFVDEQGHTTDAYARTQVERALSQARRLRRLTQDLLDVRRLQRGGFALELERFPLDQVVARSVEAAQAIAPAGRTITLESTRAALLVNGDVDRLEQVLMNLLSNAITYAPDSPRIAVRLQREGNEAVLHVRDTGPGIPADHLPHIFARFYQIQNAVDRPSRRGLGLGLFIAHELVMAHGGTLTVASVAAPDKDHGTTFTMRLPLAPGDTGELGGHEPSGKGKPGRKRE